MPLFTNKIWTREHFQSVARFLIRHSLLLFVSALFLTALSILALTRLKIDSNYMAFLPDNFPGVAHLEKVIEKTGGFGNFMIVIEEGVKEDRRKYAKEISKKIESLTWVDYAEYKKDRKNIEKNKFLYLSKEDLTFIRDELKFTIDSRKNPISISFLDEDLPFLEKIKNIERKYQQTSFGSNYFEDPNLLYTIVLVWPQGSMTDIEFAKKCYEDLKKIISENPPKNTQIKTSIGGEYRNKVDEYYALMSDLKSSTVIAIVGIALLLFFFFQKKAAIFFVLTPLVMGVLWSFGVATLIIGSFNILTAFLVTILFGLGVDYGIYLYSRYLEERKQGLSLEKTIAVVLYDTGQATLAAAITTSLAFLSLTFLHFRGFKEFGFLAFCGIIVLFFCYLILSPVLWTLCERWNFIEIQKLKSQRLILTRPYLSNRVMYVFVFTALMGLFLSRTMSFEYDYSKLRSTNGAFETVSKKIHQVFPLSKTPAVVITDNLEETKELVHLINEKMKNSETIDAVKSILDFMPDEILEKRKILLQIKTLIEKNIRFFNEDETRLAESYLPYLSADSLESIDIPQNLKRYFEGLPGSPGHLVFIYDKVRLSDARNALKYAQDIREFKTESKTFYPAEGSLLFADALTLMKKDSKMAIFLILTGVYFVLVFNFLSFKKALIVFLPLIISIMTTVAILSFLNIKLNMFNMIIFPILIGIGVDSFIHMYHRYLEDKASIKSIQNMYLFIGNPLLLATFTTLIGFSSMLVSNHQGLQTTGLVAFVGIICQSLTSILFFPSFLRWKDKRLFS